MTETLSYGYSSENTQRELSNEYQHAIDFLSDFPLKAASVFFLTDSRAERVLSSSIVLGKKMAPFGYRFT